MVVKDNVDKMLDGIIILLVASLVAVVVLLPIAEQRSRDSIITNVTVELTNSVSKENMLVISSIDFEIEKDIVVELMLKEPKTKFNSKTDYESIGLDLLTSGDNYEVEEVNKESLVKAIENKYIKMRYKDVYKP